MRTVVVDFELQRSRFATRMKLNDARPGVRFDAVLNGIFHQRLQHQIRHQCVERVRRNVHFHREPSITRTFS